MRYQLPIYPLLCMMAAWFLFEVAGLKVGRLKDSRMPKVLASILGVTVVLLTAAWAFAFQSMYLRPEPRIAASRWINQNVPGPINLQIQTDEGVVNQPIPFPYDRSISPGVPYSYIFTPHAAGLLEEVILPRAIEQTDSDQPIELVFSLYSSASPEEVLASETIRQVMSTGVPGESINLQFKVID